MFVSEFWKENIRRINLFKFETILVELFFYVKKELDDFVCILRRSGSSFDFF